MFILAILGTAFYVIGGLLSFIYSIVILVQSFKTSLAWGLISLLVPFGIIIYVFKYWEETKSPFFKVLIGIGIMILGGVLALLAAGASGTATA